MAFKFLPKAEKDISSGFENLPAGEYPFTVLESGITQSKSDKNKGKEMCAVKICVHGPNNLDKHIFDYFADWFSEWKLKHFCETVGLAKEYAAGVVAPDSNGWSGREGYVKIKMGKAQNGYEAKNEVADYLPDDEQTREALSAAEPEEDDVPF